MHPQSFYSPSKEQEEQAFGQDAFALAPSPSSFGLQASSVRPNSMQSRFGRSLRPPPGSTSDFVASYPQGDGPNYVTPDMDKQDITLRRPQTVKMGSERARVHKVWGGRHRHASSTPDSVGPGAYPLSSSMGRQVASIKPSCANNRFGRDSTRRNDPVRKNLEQGDFTALPSTVGWQRRGVQRNAASTRFSGSQRHFWIPRGNMI